MTTRNARVFACLLAREFMRMPCLLSAPPLPHSSRACCVCVCVAYRCGKRLAHRTATKYTHRPTQPRVHCLLLACLYAALLCLSDYALCVRDVRRSCVRRSAQHSARDALFCSRVELAVVDLALGAGGSGFTGRRQRPRRRRWCCCCCGFAEHDGETTTTTCILSLWCCWCCCCCCTCIRRYVCTYVHTSSLNIWHHIYVFRVCNDFKSLTKRYECILELS